MRTVFGAITGGVSAGACAFVVKILENSFFKNSISIKNIAEIFGQNPDQVNNVWTFLVNEGYVT